MNRLQKKCLVFSTATHGVLLLVVVAGSAFLPSPPPTPDLPIIDFIPDKVVDEAMYGGGLPAPAARPSPPIAKPPAPQPAPPVKPAEMLNSAPITTTTPERHEAPKTAPEPPEKPLDKPLINKDDSENFDLDKKPKPPKINLEKTVRTPARESSSNRKKLEAARAAQEAQAATARAWNDKLSHAFNDIQQNLSRSVSVEGIGSGGVGGGGPSYANWKQLVQSQYQNSWNCPDEVSDASIVTTVEVTILRDGTVSADKITKFSGNSLFDRSVSDVLARVRSVQPFPESAKDQRRTLNIIFYPQRKRLF